VDWREGEPASVLVVGAVVSVRLDAPLAEVPRHGGEVLPCWAWAGFEVGRRVYRVGRRSPGVWPAARCADEEGRFGIGGFESETSFSGPGLRWAVAGPGEPGLVARTGLSYSNCHVGPSVLCQF
jgi:hypothetical protein